MSQKYRNKEDVDAANEATQSWGNSANNVIAHMHNGGWSPWTSMDRYVMALKSIPAAVDEKRAYGEATGQPNHEDNRYDLYNKAVDAASAGQPAYSPWSQMFGKPY